MAKAPAAAVFGGSDVEIVALHKFEDALTRPSSAIVERTKSGQIIATQGVAAFTLDDGTVLSADLFNAYQTFTDNGKGLYAAIQRGVIAPMQVPTKVPFTNGYQARTPGFVVKLADDDAKAFGVDSSWVTLVVDGMPVGEVGGTIILETPAMMQLLKEHGGLPLELPVSEIKAMDLSIWEEEVAHARETGALVPYESQTYQGQTRVTYGFRKGNQRSAAIEARAAEAVAALSTGFAARVSVGSVTGAPIQQAVAGNSGNRAGWRNGNSNNRRRGPRNYSPQY